MPIAIFGRWTNHTADWIQRQSLTRPGLIDVWMESSDAQTIPGASLPTPARSECLTAALVCRWGMTALAGRSWAATCRSSRTSERSARSIAASGGCPLGAGLQALPAVRGQSRLGQLLRTCAWTRSHRASSSGRLTHQLTSAGARPWRRCVRWVRQTDRPSTHHAPRQLDVLAGCHGWRPPFWMPPTRRGSEWAAEADLPRMLDTEPITVVREGDPPSDVPLWTGRSPDDDCVWDQSGCAATAART